MSKAHAKQPAKPQASPAQANKQPAGEQAAAPATAATAEQPRAVVRPAPAKPVKPGKPGKPDENAGKGGLYTVADGVRTLVDRTERDAAHAPASKATTQE